MPCLRPHVDYMIRNRDHILVMLDYKNGIPLVPKFLKQVIHTVDIPGMHPSAWLVKDIGHPGQTASHVPD
ncbi:hypothetical protein SDC9_191386 [bioreactor metagenome]|uniref:Uncharacterized protein n=1 Tax=bioreactor metagenome TaxID=1076179 RepID=A0A645HXQ8_9ZZZZ